MTTSASSQPASASANANDQSVANPVTPTLAPPLSSSLRLGAEVLASVLEGRTPDAALAAVASDQRPAVMDLVFTTLRAYGRGDFFLARLMQKPLTENGQPLIRALLLLALQRLEQEVQSAHTTVDQAVTAASEIHHGKFKALVNGVLRNFLRQRAELSAAAAADPIAHTQHPIWWHNRLQRNHPQDWTAIVAAGNSRPPMSLRINLRRTTAADFCRKLDAAGIGYRALGPSTVLLNTPMPVSRLPGFAEGECSVQDAGAQLAASLLDAQPGMRVLDACAAPGGKTAHLLEQAELDLLALDADVTRLERVRENLARLQLSATLKVADARSAGSWWNGQPFERILADVPCSASGVVRRHPDAKWLRRSEDVASFARTQATILESLWPTLARGGKLLYVTCSLFTRENGGQIERFVATHSDAVRLPIDVPPDHSVQTAARLNNKELLLLPNDDHDGFFYALLAKR